jgi:hypothetical protein
METEAIISRFRYMLCISKYNPVMGTKYKGSLDGRLNSLHNLFKLRYTQFHRKKMHSVFIAVAFGLFASQATAKIALGNNANNNRKSTALVNASIELMLT